MRLMCTKLTGLGLFSIPHTSENKSRLFPLTYSQRCETIFAPPASYSRSKHPVVNGIWNRVFQCLMRPFRIVGMSIVPNQLPKLLGRLILSGVNLFCLQTAEPALNHDIICPAALPIHTLPDLQDGLNILQS